MRNRIANENRPANRPFTAVQQVDPDGQKDIGEGNITVGPADISGIINTGPLGNENATGPLGTTNTDTPGNGPSDSPPPTETSTDK